MSDKIFLNARYAFRSDMLENWQNINPVLENGEPAIVSDGTDGEWLKIGDGVNTFNNLEWKKGPKGDKGDAGQGGTAEVDQTYNPGSKNAQSGVAVAEALTTKIVSLPSPSGIFNLETNKIYSFGIYSDVTFVLPQVDTGKFNSIELQVRISGCENIHIDLGAAKYFSDIPEFSDGYYIIYYEHNGQDWCVGALEIVGA